MSDKLPSNNTPQAVVEKVPEEAAIASSLIPYDRDEPKSMYLGCRSIGFSVRETLQRIGRSKQWLSLAKKEDPEFASLCNRIPEFRKAVSKDFLSIEYFRNFSLVMEKDYRTLRRSLDLEIDETTGEVVKMTSADHAYLGKMRAQYTPQALGILEAIVSSGDSNFDFAKWVAANADLVKLSRTESITMQRPHDG